MEDSPTTPQIPFEVVLQALLDDEHPFPPSYLHRLSDMAPHHASALKKAWPLVNPIRRAVLLEDLGDLSEADTLVCFDDVGYLGLNDENGRARAAAITLLWECSDSRLANKLVKMLDSDPDENVRAMVANLLGQFVYRGEVEEVNVSCLKEVENGLLKAYETDTDLVRRKCLESLGYSSRDEVPDMIEEAYQSDAATWRASALYAMGRSADDERWKEIVMQNLDSSFLDIQIEAIRAAGELQLEETRQPIIKMVKELSTYDDDLRTAIIWSLSQIGGDQVVKIFGKLIAKAKDDEEEEFIQSAIDNLEFAQGLQVNDLLDVGYPDEEEMIAKELIQKEKRKASELDDSDDVEDEESSKGYDWEADYRATHEEEDGELDDFENNDDEIEDDIEEDDEDEIDSLDEDDENWMKQ